MSGPPILNPRPAGPDWHPITFRASLNGQAQAVHGFGREWFAVFCPRACGHRLEDEFDDARQVLVVHLPTGLQLAECRHGSQAFRLADDLLGIPEFGQPFDVDRLEQREADVVGILRHHGVAA